MIEKVQNSDGTIINFDLIKTIDSISDKLQQQANIEKGRAMEIAKNVIELISERFVSSIPSTKDFEDLVGLVLQTETAGVIEEQQESSELQEPQVSPEPQEVQQEEQLQEQPQEVQQEEQLQEQPQEVQQEEQLQEQPQEVQQEEQLQEQPQEVQQEEQLQEQPQEVQQEEQLQVNELQEDQNDVYVKHPTLSPQENNEPEHYDEGETEDTFVANENEEVETQVSETQYDENQVNMSVDERLQSEPQNEDPVVEIYGNQNEAETETKLENEEVKSQDSYFSEMTKQDNNETNETLSEESQETIETNTEVAELETSGVHLSKQAKRIICDSTVFNELGRSIFLDRYALKAKRDTIELGDLVVILTKEDRKYPIKDLGIVKKLVGDKITAHMITGKFSDEENNFEFETSIWKCDKPIESIKDAHSRVARAMASVEKTPELQDKWAKTFLDQLQKKHIQPAGRIMTGASVGEDAYTKNLTLFNCYVIPSPKDCRRGIIQGTLYQMCEIMSRGGGVGINLSSLRPRYAYVKGVHGKSSGAVSWGGIFSYATSLIEQGGSRRGALMLMMHDWHPDVLEFINAKRKKGVIENANISILVSDKFMQAVKDDANWDLVFPDFEQEDIKEYYDKKWDGQLQTWLDKGLPTKVYQTIKARDIWNQIITSAHASAEPGIVFSERYNKLSNSYYYNNIVCTNPCGEQGLPPWGVCNLGHLYLASFLKQVGNDEEGPLYEIEWNELKEAARVLTRFLDNVIDKTPYHFKENEDNQMGERRVGGGTLGLGEMLVKLRIKYGSNESIKLIDQLYQVICNEMYKASAFLAEEKGAFPKFDSEAYLNSGFTKKLPEDVRQTIRELGIRNVTLTTQAPTGTVGTMLATTTGIEPYYAFDYFRQSRMGFHQVKIPLAESYTREDGTLPSYFITAMQMNPLDHIKVQAAVQEWTDSSISKTANAPEHFTVEETRELYEQAYNLGCKGVTIYRDNCRYEQVLSTDENKGEKNAASAEEVSSEASANDANDSIENAKSSVPETLETKDSEESDGASCELKIDEYGQTYKSCSE